MMKKGDHADYFSWRVSYHILLESSSKTFSTLQQPPRAIRQCLRNISVTGVASIVQYSVKQGNAKYLYKDVVTTMALYGVVCCAVLWSAVPWHAI